MSGTMSGTMKSRILLAIAALVMLPAFVTPLWTIHLTAPQYSDGLGMHIYVHDVRGHERHDLQNINILNHYIGMQPIEPEEIPELEIMPWILGGLVVTGLVVAAIGSPWLMAGWLGLFLVAGAAGMVDFYLWNIDYGHNLSPDAPIRIPDMTYSPPIIGTEQILNIRASSYPHLGSLFLAISALLAGWAVFLGFRARDGTTSSGVVLLLVVLLAACGGPGEPASNSGGGSEGQSDRIVYGESQDPYCGGTVEQVRWGGELRTTDGERLRFRSVECLAAYLLEGKVDQTRVESVKVVDFPDGWKLLDAERATFLHSPNLSSPNGLNILAIEAPKMQQNLKDAYTGPLLSWTEVLELVAREWEVDDVPPGEIS
ncbi:MAG: hypothetical protein EA351_01200 [Gemmatimonadales bacterium]|nr:MAG: hypothetical protein EA351_01200 [Gemmatimonadales bacterium]